MIRNNAVSATASDLSRWSVVLTACLLFLSGCPKDDGPGQTPEADAGMTDTGGSFDGGDTDPFDPPPESFETVSCGGDSAIPAAPDGQRCGVEPGNDRRTLVRGDVLAGNTVYEDGAVLIDRQSGEISCVGCGCGKSADAAGASILNCADAVISPGLINPHEHLGWSTVGPAIVPPETRYDHRHEWRVGANDGPRLERPGGTYSREALLHGELRHLLGGATSVAGSARGSTVSGLLRNLDDEKDTSGLDSQLTYSTFPLGDTSGTLREEGCDYGRRGRDSVDVLAADTYLPHVSEGLGTSARNEFTCMSSNAGDARDLMETNTTIVHGIGMTATDVRTLAREGGALVWSPRSNISLYGQTADIPTYRAYGVPIGLGTDWALSGSRNILRELACADRYNRDYLDEALSDWELWRMVTVDAARVLGVGDRLGRLEAGYEADVAIFAKDGRTLHQAVVEAADEDVVMVIRDGQPLLGDAELIDGLVSAGAIDGCASFDQCSRQRRVCVGLDTKGEVDLTALREVAEDSSYPLFACEGDTVSEPTCVPSRPGQYDGQPTKDDADGDGIADTADNCPARFNPPRPLEGAQPDDDGDGVGDTCDTCPTDASDSCTDDDFDGDGAPNRMDNCPLHENGGQADGDGDGIGDACDECPAPNSLTGPCPASVYEARGASFGPGDKVRFEDVVVTASSAPDGDPEAIFVQMSPDDSRWMGPQRSGMYVYVGGGHEVPRRGDVVDVEGIIKNFYGLREIGAVSSLTMSDASRALPDPVTVSAEDIAGDEPDHPLMAALVTVKDAAVTDDTPDTTDALFAVGGGLLIGTQLFEIDPPPKSGGTFEGLTGPLFHAFGANILVPRSAQDVGAYDGERKPGRPNSEGALAFTELMANPDVESDSDGEWFELHHPDGAGVAYNLRGCELVEGDDDVHEIEDKLIVEPGGWVALARSEEPGFTEDYVYSGLGLTNSGGSLALRCRDTLIDAMTYDSGAVEAGESWSLGADSLNATANDDAANWCPATASYNGDLGTPGAANPSCSP